MPKTAVQSNIAWVVKDSCCSFTRICTITQIKFYICTITILCLIEILPNKPTSCQELFLIFFVDINKKSAEYLLDKHSSAVKIF